MYFVFLSVRYQVSLLFYLTKHYQSHCCALVRQLNTLYLGKGFFFFFISEVSVCKQTELQYEVTTSTDSVYMVMIILIFYAVL